jgi:hypothetical protein
MSGEQHCSDPPVDDCDENGVHVREHVNYLLTVHIRNNGPGTATNVRAVIRTPEEFEVERISPDVCDHSRFCELGTLESGQDAVITLRGEYGDPAHAHNWVFVSSDTLDPDHENNEAGQRGVVEEPVAKTQGDLSCVLTGGDENDPIEVDDDLELFLNGSSFFNDNDEFAGPLSPVEFRASRGDELRVVASNSDFFGGAESLSPLNLFCDGQEQQLDNGFGPSSGPNGEVFYDETFTIDP